MGDRLKPIVVIDTQLFLRATLNPKSLPARMLFSLKDAYLLAVSPAVRAEVADVLTRPRIRAKFSQMTDQRIAQTLAVLDAGLQLHPEDVLPISRDPKDDIFLALAMESKAKYLVSEDNDLLVLNPYKDIRILNALDFIRELEILAADEIPAPDTGEQNMSTSE